MTTTQQGNKGKAVKPKLTAEQRKAARRPNFVRLANKRGNTVLKGIRSIGKLGNASAYDYTEQDVAALFGSIREAVAQAEAQFTGKGDTKAEPVTLVS